MELELPGGRVRVDALSERHKAYAERLEFIEKENQVAQVASETVQAPDDQNIERSPLRVSQQFIERRTTVVRPCGPQLIRSLPIFECPSINRSNVRMVQRGEDFRFALKA